MNRSQMVWAVDDDVSAAVPSCVQDATTLCATVYGWFGLDWLAANADTLIATPARMLLIVVRTTNVDQWRVGRELRMRLKERFVAEGFRTPAPLLGSVSAAGAGAR